MLFMINWKGSDSDLNRSISFMLEHTTLSPSSLHSKSSFDVGSTFWYSPVFADIFVETAKSLGKYTLKHGCFSPVSSGHSLGIFESIKEPEPAFLNFRIIYTFGETVAGRLSEFSVAV